MALNEKVNNAKLNQGFAPTVSLTGTVSPDETAGADFSGVLALGPYFYGVDSGTPNAALVVTPLPLIGYSDGLVLAFRCMNANTGATTLQVQTPTTTLAARPILKPLVSIAAGGPCVPLGAGDLLPGLIIEVRYRLDGDLIDSAVYSGGGSITVPVIPGFTYLWTKGANDTSLTYTGVGGATVLAVSGSFVPTTNSITLAGTASVPSGGTLIASSDYWQLMNGAGQTPGTFKLLTALKFR